MNKKRLVITAMVVTSALLIASVTTTVAWFAGSPYLEYNNIQIGLSDKNIEISDDDVNWQSTLDGDHFEKIDNFKPVTTMYSDSWLSEKRITPEFRNGYSTAETQFVNDPDKVTLATTGFFSHDIYLRADADTYLTIDTTKTYFAANEIKNKAAVSEVRYYYPELTEEQILENLNSIQKSLRMSILVLNDEGSNVLRDYKYYIIEPYKDRDTLFGGILDNDENKYYDHVGDIDSGSAYESVYGDVSNEDKAVYDDVSEYDSEIVGDYSVFNAKTEKHVHHFNLEKSLENGMTIASENSIALEEADSKVYIPLTANLSKKLVISFYLEGWDLDNTNVTMYANFSINISFMVATSRSE